MRSKRLWADQLNRGRAVPTWHRPSLARDTSFTATAWQPVGDHLRCPTVLACATAPPLVAGDRLTTAVERALPSLVLVLGRGLVAGGSRVKGGQQNLRVADPHRVEVRAPRCCQQSASNRTTRSLAWLMHAREVSAVYLWRHAVGDDHAWGADRRLLQRAQRGDQPADQEGEAGRAWLPQLRQLPAAVAAALRHQVADSPHRKAAPPAWWRRACKVPGQL
jgi:hypothetical protein